MNVSTRFESGVAILDLDGKLVIGSGDQILRGQILSSLEEGHRKILVNLKNVSMVDSSGLGELIRSKATCAKHDAQIKLLHVHEKLYKLLTMSQLIGVLEIYEKEEDALKSFE